MHVKKSKQGVNNPPGACPREQGTAGGFFCKYFFVEFVYLFCLPDGVFGVFQKRKNPEKHRFFKAFSMVGVAGFEPTASWTRTKRDTKLRHTPNLLIHYSSEFGECQAFFVGIVYFQFYKCCVFRVHWNCVFRMILVLCFPEKKDKRNRGQISARGFVCQINDS